MHSRDFLWIEFLVRTGICELRARRMIPSLSPWATNGQGFRYAQVIQGDNPLPAKADPTLLKEITRAHRCFNALMSGGASIAQLAAREGVDDRYVSNVLPLAFLAPEIVGAIVKGTQPADLTATKLVRRIDLALDWDTQKRQLGFA